MTLAAVAKSLPSAEIVTPDLAVDIARFATNLDASRLSPVVVAAVKANILDTLACAIAGSSAKGIGELSDLVREWAGAPQATMLVLGGRFPAHHVAWVNGSMAHARDYDDTHDAAVLHAGVSTVPAALAAAQLHGKVSGADLIAAVAAGLEVTCRLGMATKIGVIESGYMYTSLLGYFGATVAAGRAMSLTPEQMVNAIGIVYSSAAGNHQVTRDAALTKRMQPGFAAQAAVAAVQVAKRGIRGVQKTFEGIDGFFRVYLHNNCNGADVRAGLGERFELLNLSYKPYPCCRYNHSAVDATLQARARMQRAASDIKSIRVGVTAQCYEAVCTPEEVRRSPRTIVEAQFSIPYTVAASWIDGRLGLSHFTDESLRRADILDLATRVQPYVDADIEREWSRNISPAKVNIQFTDGQTLETRVDYPKGHPKSPMSLADIEAKVDDCARFAAKPLPADTARRLTAAIKGLDSLADISDLVGILS